jgi:hypothetical protein
MRRPSRRKLTIGAIGAAGTTGALALALVAPHVAFAQDPTPTPSASTSAPAASPRGADQAKRQDELATALAQELGIDKAKVAAALAKIEADRPKPANPPSSGTAADRAAQLKTRLDAAVKAGTITQAEEDAIIKAAQAGVLPGGGPGGPGGHGPGGAPPTASPTK